MRERNWPQYNKQLVQRGSLTFLIDKKTLKSLKFGPKQKGVGRPTEFSDPLILLLFLVKIHYRLPYRALEGFAEFIFSRLMNWLKIPTYSLICKRACALHKTLPKLSNRHPHTVLLDASGMRVVGEGEWKVKIHGRGRPRKWIKVHIAVDPLTQEIVAEATTVSSCADANMTRPLLEAAGGNIRTVIADGAYDNVNGRGVVKDKQARALIPPPKNAQLRGDGGERDDAIRVIRGLGGDKQARSIWGKLTGYSRRVLVETAFSRLKRLYGDRMFSQSLKLQLVESHLKCYLLNKLNAIRP